MSSGASYGRFSDQALDNLGSMWEGRWMDAATWPCSLPGCSNRVDPDSPMQYCSKAHEKRALTLNTPSYAQRAEQQVARTNAWYDKGVATGEIRKVC